MKKDYWRDGWLIYRAHDDWMATHTFARNRSEAIKKYMGNCDSGIWKNVSRENGVSCIKVHLSWGWLDQGNTPRQEDKADE